MDKNYQNTASRVSMISILGNVILSLFKLIAGIVANSSAMVSDAIHSASDVLSSAIVILGVRLASREPDDEHPYGHERLECVASIILAVILFVTGIFIGYSALGTIISKDYANIKIPGLLALLAAIISIVAKEAMFWYTRHYARKIESGALMAEAWHHRSDALSSVGALIGIAAARLGYPFMDAVASLIIFAFIIKASVDIFKDAMKQMVDRACDEDTEAALRDCVLGHEDVLGVDLLQTRIFGNRIYVDVEILLDGALTLTEAHEIAEKVHDRIEDRFPKVKHIMVHVNPN